jgi:hypothetical protein
MPLTNADVIALTAEISDGTINYFNIDGDIGPIQQVVI